MSQPAWSSGSALPEHSQPLTVLAATWPLWAFFSGPAVLGLACCSTMLRLSRTEGFLPFAQAWLEPTLRACEAAAEGVEALTNAVVEPVLEGAAEAMGGALGEALTNQVFLKTPVGGEAGPFSATVLEAAALSKRGGAAVPPSIGRQA